MKKRFTIEYESDDQTHWLYTDAALMDTLQCLAESAGETHTQGSRPRVKITTQPETTEPLIPPLQ